MIRLSSLFCIWYCCLDVFSFVIKSWLLQTTSLLMLILVLYSWHKQSFFRKYGIRTKKTWMILGDLPLIMKRGLGYITLDDVRQNGKVFGTFVGNLPSLVVTDVEIIKLMMTKHFPTFMNRAKTPFPVVKGSERLFPSAVGENWKLIRHTLSPAFTLAKLKPMVPHINQCLNTLNSHISECIEKYPDGFDIRPLIKNFTLDVILHVGFGIHTDTQTNPDNAFVKHARGFLEYDPFNPLMLIFFIIPELKRVTGFLDFTPFPVESLHFYRTALQDMINNRKLQENGYKDLLQLMVNAQRKQKEEGCSTDYLHDEDMIGNAVICMIAGYDTTSSVLSWFLYDMVVHPECQDKLREEIHTLLGKNEASYDTIFELQYLDMLLSETLRIHPPGSSIARMSTEDIELCGVRIPKEIEVSIPKTVLHFMPEYWDSPEQYIPERFSSDNRVNIEPYAYLPFGLGPRCCVASKLALLELKLAIVHIFKNFTLRKTDHLQIPLPEKRLLVISPDAPITVVAEKNT